MEHLNSIKYDILQGTADDTTAIAQFQVDMALESEGTKLNLDTVTQGVAAAMKDSAKGIYVVAKANDNPVASLMITQEWSDWNNQWYWWVQSVYVMPAHRGKGVYKAMYEKVKKMAAEHHVTQIRLYVDKTNHSAQQVYQKTGMQECHYLMYEEQLSK